jgi:hypothetical protein
MSWQTNVPTAGELLERRETAFEHVARRVGAGWEIAGGREK